MLLFVGTPNLQARCNRLAQILRSSSSLAGTIHLTPSSSTAEAAATAATAATAEEEENCLRGTEDTFRNYMLRHWGRVRFLSFSENEALLRAVVNLAVRNPTKVLHITTSHHTITHHASALYHCTLNTCFRHACFIASHCVASANACCILVTRRCPYPCSCLKYSHIYVNPSL